MFPQCFPRVMPNKIKFTDLALKKLAPIKGKRFDYSDLDCPGLILRHTENDVKTFSFAFRIGVKTGRLTLGKYPHISIRQARQVTADMKKMIAQGFDPRTHKQSSIKAKETTVNSMIKEFIEIYAKPKNTSWKQADSNLKLYLADSLGREPVKEIKRTDIHKILDRLSAAGKHTACNRALAHMKRFFGWLVERGYIEHSPADHIKPRHTERPRERVLTDQEINSIWKASKKLSKSYKAWVRLLLLCGQRETETARIRKSQLTKKEWHLSSTDTKNKMPSIVPFSKQPQKIIEELKQTDNEFLLTSGVIGDNPINGFSKAKKQMDRLSGVTDWTWHDVRTAVATNLAILGFDRAIIKRVLNHSDGGVTAVYDRYTYVEEKRKALQKWADKLDDITR